MIERSRDTAAEAAGQERVGTWEGRHPSPYFLRSVMRIRCGIGLWVEARLRLSYTQMSTESNDAPLR